MVFTTMVTPKRGPLKIDLTGLDGKRKIDAEWNPLNGKYHVRIRGRSYYWTATQFAEMFRQWLTRQKENL